MNSGASIKSHLPKIRALSFRPEPFKGLLSVYGSPLRQVQDTLWTGLSCRYSVATK